MTAEITILDLSETANPDPKLVLATFKNYVQNGKSILPSSVYNIINKITLSRKQLIEAKAIMLNGFLIQEKIKNMHAASRYNKAVLFLGRKLIEMKNPNLFICNE